MKRKLHVAIVVSTLILCMFLTSIGVAAKPSVYNNGKIDSEFFCYPKKANNNVDYFIFEKMTSNSRVKNLKSSNSKIATAKWSSSLPQAINITVKKKGTAKITGTLYEGSKKIKNFSINLKVYKYQNPVKSIEINGKNYASKFKNDSFYSLKMPSSKKAKIKITPKSGWKLKGIWHSYMSSDSSTSPKQYKNGKTIKLKGSSANFIDSSLMNIKTGEYETLSFIIE